MIKKLLPFACLVAITVLFFWQFFFKGLLPIPADTIIGLYHPYRDLYSKDYPNGIPFKNFLITDPVRQQYPWRQISINSFKNLELPIWNPYSFTGTPLLANVQSGVFYPLNILFIFLPFEISWSTLILLEPLLASIFMFAYLRNLKLDKYSSFFGAIVFSFSGFFTTWLEWGTILHVGLWLPLILLSIDKVRLNIKDNRQIFIWSIILIFSTVSSFFAGHLQIFFYLSLVGAIYVILRIWQSRNKKLAGILFITWLITLVVVSIQLVPALKFILLSARDLDQILWQKDGWFIPWQHLVQFIAPDFFGNPTTLNYWGVWNYGELTPYVGILPLILVFYAMLFRKDKKTLLFGSIFFTSMIFSLPTPIAKLPFLLEIPFISTAQPTRLLFLIDFSLSVLAALGLNYLKKSGKWKEIISPVAIVGILIIVLFGFSLMGQELGIKIEDLETAKRNLILPLSTFAGAVLLIFLFFRINEKHKQYLMLALILLTIFDLFRFSWKFNTFSKKEYLFPSTLSIDFLKKNTGEFRIATSDPRILPPNFSSVYKIQSVEGYDPLFVQRYAEFVSAINRNKADINPPFGFNRIVRIDNFSSPLVDLIGVKYVLSLSDLRDPRFTKVFEENQTKIYENTKVVPRTFFAEQILTVVSKQETIGKMFESGFDPGFTVYLEDEVDNADIGKGTAQITSYKDNEVTIETNNDKEGFLVLTDSFYPSWHAKIDSSSEVKIFRADYIFRGVFIPAGRHTVRFYNSLL